MFSASFLVKLAERMNKRPYRRAHVDQDDLDLIGGFLSAVKRASQVLRLSDTCMESILSLFWSFLHRCILRKTFPFLISLSTINHY